MQLLTFPVLTFSSLQNIPCLRHAVTTRAGGVSREEYSALNLAFHVGDEAGAVCENRTRLAHLLGYDASTLVAAQQVHGTSSRVVNAQMRGRGAWNLASALADCDALIVGEAGVPILIQVADCAPILLVDPVHKVLAVIHAGWRGAVGDIASQTMETMTQTFDMNAADIRAGIGPCLCLECLEIGEEVAAQVQSTQKASPQAASTHVARRGEWKKPHLDLRAIIRDDLTRNGVLADNIEIMDRCPRCENETFFSHRGQNGKAGRFGLVAWWSGKEEA